VVDPSALAGEGTEENGRTESKQRALDDETDGSEQIAPVANVGAVAW
jgi:hypothetical protein